MGKSEMECDCNLIHNESVARAKANMLDEDIIIMISDFYKALCDSTRAKIINALEIGELCVCDISVLLNMTKSAVSHQLKNLKQLNLIKSRKVGKEVLYSLSDKHVQMVFDISKEHVLESYNEEDC